MPSLGRIYKNRGNRWFIRLPDGLQIWCDKQHMTFHSREHAQYTLVAIQSEIKSGTFDPSFWAKRKKSLHSFGVYALEWLDNCERRLQRKELSPPYLREVRRYVHNYFIPAFGEMNMMDIKGRHLVSFHLSLEVSQKTIYNIVAVLKKLFRDAVDQEVIQVMPKFPRLGDIPEPRTTWADETQQDEIFKHLDPNTYFFVYFLATHGCRPGEARALTHADIDLKRDTVTIERAFSGTELRPFTKTKRVRVVPLDASWRELYLQQPRNIDSQAFVFTKNGKPFSMTWASKKWREAADKAGYPHINLYQGTRHSIASQAVNRDVPLYSVSKFLGHSNMKQTERYSHLNTSGLRKVQRQATVTTLKKSKS
ncbi:MAG: tyrosine-type recombinase/integrase [Dissulfurispiraceae bacterium]